MFKRFVKIFSVVMACCIMLSSCSMLDNMTLLPDKAVGSLVGAYDVMTDLLKQIKEEGLGSISSVFSSSDEETEDTSSESTDSENTDSESTDSDADSEKPDESKDK